jgi:hypothetical protein
MKGRLLDSSKKKTVKKEGGNEGKIREKTQRKEDRQI